MTFKAYWVGKPLTTFSRLAACLAIKVRVIASVVCSKSWSGLGHYVLPQDKAIAAYA
jgi:hypothetical protein